MHIILENLTAVACRKKRHLGNIKLRWEHSLRKLNVPTESKNKQTGDPSLAEHSYYGITPRLQTGSERFVI